MRVTVEPADEDRLREFMTMTATHYEGEVINDERVVRWRHLDTPRGPSIAVQLVDGESAVGRIWIQIHEWSVRGRTVRAANPVEALIREDKRSAPAFLMLYRSAMREAAARADLVFHTSNPISDQLFRKLLKLQPVTELDGALLPIRPGSLARAAAITHLGPLTRVADAVGVLGALAMGWLSRLSGLTLTEYATVAEQDVVVRRLRRAESVTGARTAEWRAWRFRGAGQIAYDVRWIRRRGRVVGYVVTSDRDVEGIRGRFVVDLVLPGGHALWALPLWLQLADSAAVAGRDALFFFFNRANPRLAALAIPPMITVGRERLPQQVPIFLKVAEGSEPAADFASVDWAAGYYTLADLDLF